MAASASKDKAAKAKDAERKDKERAAKQKEKEKAAKQKEKEREAKRKEKEKEAKRKEKDKQREAKRKEEERAAKAKAKQREARQKEKEREEKAKAKRDAQRAADAKEKERAAKARAKERETERKEREREQQAKDKARAKREAARKKPAAQETQAVEEVAVPERGDTTEVPAEVREQADAPDTTAGSDTSADDGAAAAGLAPLPELDVPANDKTIRPKGYLAEALGKEDAVGRATQRATLAASYTTRDHDIVRAWASTRGGRPSDVAGAGRRGGAGVLRIEFPDGPGDDSRLEDIDWSPFFATFDESDVDFLYQERVRTGDVSRFHKFVRAGS